MKFDLKSVLPVLNMVVDQMQAIFIKDENKNAKLYNALTDAGQKLITLAADGIDNEAQGLELAIRVAKAIEAYDGTLSVYANRVETPIETTEGVDDVETETAG